PLARPRAVLRYRCWPVPLAPLSLAALSRCHRGRAQPPRPHHHPPPRPLLERVRLRSALSTLAWTAQGPGPASRAVVGLPYRDADSSSRPPAGNTELSRRPPPSDLGAAAGPGPC